MYGISLDDEAQGITDILCDSECTMALATLRHISVLRQSESTFMKSLREHVIFFLCRLTNASLDAVAASCQGSFLLLMAVLNALFYAPVSEETLSPTPPATIVERQQATISKRKSEYLSDLPAYIADRLGRSNLVVHFEFCT